jgi:hypothetical protein
MTNVLILSRDFKFQLPHWQKARAVPFREKNQIFAQDVGSNKDTEFSSEDLTLRWRELSVEFLGRCQPTGNWLFSPRAYFRLLDRRLSWKSAPRSSVALHFYYGPSWLRSRFSRRTFSSATSAPQIYVSHPEHSVESRMLGFIAIESDKPQKELPQVNFVCLH